MTEAQPSPPACLGAAGRRLWQATMGAYILTGPQIETLTIASKLADRREECRLHLQQETLVTIDRFGQQKINPWATHELQGTAQLSRIMDRLTKQAQRRIVDTDDAEEFFGGPRRRRGADLLD